MFVFADLDCLYMLTVYCLKKNKCLFQVLVSCLFITIRFTDMEIINLLLNMASH